MRSIRGANLRISGKLSGLTNTSWETGAFSVRDYSWLPTVSFNVKRTIPPVTQRTYRYLFIAKVKLPRGKSGRQ
ncbi:MAG: hypothetical protein WA810_00795 [Maribacter sp.]